MERNQNESETPEEIPKLPFRRLRHPLSQLADTAIPLHVCMLNEQSKSIESLINENKPLLLHQQQLKACKTLQLLKADLYEIEQLNSQLEEKDQEQFDKVIRKPLKEAVEAISNFTVSHSDVLGPFLDIDCDASDQPGEFPKLVCDGLNNPEASDGLIYSTASDELTECSAKAYLTSSESKNWSFLRKEILEIHSLITYFTSLVFRQQESIDSIQSNIVQTHENVKIGTEYLKKASVLKAATFPLLGAVIGGVALGPIGALAGFKVLGSFACIAGGSALGYKAGVKLKEKREEVCDMELKALTYHSKTSSSSTPNLSTHLEKIEK
ncbi:syntaxin-17 [Nephila pilipes]|uniref:Syntaxin-17 n=1 Tax=Nephila pilipes TaxID=299642 RepID=A0A8X6TD38_NEPPI|nr:syntaxin-17 [Nephila pilipes]